MIVIRLTIVHLLFELLHADNIALDLVLNDFDCGISDLVLEVVS